MMLTADTAHAMGLKDRTNPGRASSRGRAISPQVRAMIPDRIPEPDRTWLTVAAYNVGFGHLEDARILAQAFGKNPDSWAEVRARLPLLAQERWYARARRGYARGWEPVQFVDRIQRYLTLLEWQPGEAVVPGRDNHPRTRSPGRAGSGHGQSRDSRSLRLSSLAPWRKELLQQPRATPP